MYKYTIQYAVPATVTTGPEFVKWIKGVVEADTYKKLEEKALAELDSDDCLFYGRWKPSIGIVEVFKVFKSKSIAAASLKENKEIYKSLLAKPVFSKVLSATQDEINKIGESCI